MLRTSIYSRASTVHRENHAFTELSETLSTKILTGAHLHIYAKTMSNAIKRTYMSSYFIASNVYSPHLGKAAIVDAGWPGQPPLFPAQVASKQNKSLEKN